MLSDYTHTYTFILRHIKTIFDFTESKDYFMYTYKNYLRLHYSITFFFNPAMG